MYDEESPTERSLFGDFDLRRAMSIDMNAENKNPMLGDAKVNPASPNALSNFALKMPVMREDSLNDVHSIITREGRFSSPLLGQEDNNSNSLPDSMVDILDYLKNSPVQSAQSSPLVKDTDQTKLFCSPLVKDAGLQHKLFTDNDILGSPASNSSPEKCDAEISVDSPVSTTITVPCVSPFPNHGDNGLHNYAATTAPAMQVQNESIPSHNINHPPNFMLKKPKVPQAIVKPSQTVEARTISGSKVLVSIRPKAAATSIVAQKFNLVPLSVQSTGSVQTPKVSVDTGKFRVKSELAEGMEVDDFFSDLKPIVTLNSSRPRRYHSQKPEDISDVNKYTEWRTKRDRNNESVRKTRAKKKVKEVEMAKSLRLCQEENRRLRIELDVAKRQLACEKELVAKLKRQTKLPLSRQSSKRSS